MGKFCRRPKFAQKEVGVKKGFLFFFLLLPQKGEVPTLSGRDGRGDDSASLPDRSSCFSD
jgi:hypothetical protein